MDRNSYVKYLTNDVEMIDDDTVNHVDLIYGISDREGMIRFKTFMLFFKKYVFSGEYGDEIEKGSVFASIFMQMYEMFYEKGYRDACKEHMSDKDYEYFIGEMAEEIEHSKLIFEKWDSTR